ncbi:hypothetical protein TNCV_743371 [Trichonephila clavipes]|nr:hypothetical protein TNCV_743371 [Trichonephila clavipes]
MSEDMDIAWYEVENMSVGKSHLRYAVREMTQAPSGRSQLGSHFLTDRSSVGRRVSRDVRDVRPGSSNRSCQE